MKYYFEKCNLAQTGIKNPKMGEKILENMNESKACNNCGVMKECKKFIEYNIKEVLNPNLKKSI